MYLFVFDYLGEPHCAACNESSLEYRSQVFSVYYEDLASISIEKYLNSLSIREKGGQLKNVKIYQIDGVDKDFDIEHHLVHTIKDLNITDPKSNINL